MSETLAHGSALAQRFCEEHQVQFAEAFNEDDVTAKFFSVAVDEFDDWLVRQGAVEAPASRFASNSLERRGAVMRRNETRRWMNRFAINSDTYPAYEILPAKKGALRIRLVTLYAHEAPDEISGRIKVSTRHYQRVIQSAIKILNKSQHVRVEDRAAMVAFSRFMAPMLDAFAVGMVSAIRGAERTKRRYERKRQQ